MMIELLLRPTTIRFFSLAGSAAAILGALIAALAYRGKTGERYSPFNHFISELGERGVSRLAWSFNAGLIACGLLLLPCCLGLGLLIPGVWSKLALVAGTVAAVAVALVGVFPMDQPLAHGRAAMTFFRAGLVMILLFSLAIGVQPAQAPALPTLVGLAGVPAVGAYAFFLAYARIEFSRPADALSATLARRPAFWPLATAEWLVFLTTVPWFVAVSLSL